ncbi:antiviral reverse transcriptase Drt5 [Pseudomonas promysalinigenes]|uniref:antiviral reverse transcriptase Drt5 n=1 Tax=Pseudomonas promysalinigenes TaxID=485898 RepID=UPI00271C4165
MNTREFFELDFMSGLFPLKTNKLMMENAGAELAEYVQRALSDLPGDTPYNFQGQERAHAAKPNHHLRRTIVLDPVCTFFIYDLVYRNRRAFDSRRKADRVSFGYRFIAGFPVAVHKAFGDYTKAINTERADFDHSLSFDIASYFNAIYHHDLTNWFANLTGVTSSDAKAFGIFMREINSGRSIDFLPHGLYPTKMIGAGFLSFVESSAEIKSACSLRFMDDIHLFDDSRDTLVSDFLKIQDLLGGVALNVNAAKTSFDFGLGTVNESASTIRLRLREILDDDHPRVYFGSGSDWSDEDYDEDDDEDEISSEKISELEDLLLDVRADEADVELILGILQENDAVPATAIPTLYLRFPNIAKQLYKLVAASDDKDTIASGFAEMLDSEAELLEYQLFWLAVIAEDHLSNTDEFGELVMGIYERSDAYEIVAAKVLEIPDQTFGLKAIRSRILKSGASNWKSWASAMGARTLPAAERNYILGYFANGSPMNHLIANCVKKL